MSRAMGRNREDLEAGCTELLPERCKLVWFVSTVVALIFLIVNAHLLFSFLPMWIFVGVLLMAAFIVRYGNYQQCRGISEPGAGEVPEPTHTPRTPEQLPDLRLQLALTNRDFDDLDYEDLRMLDKDNTLLAPAPSTIEGDPSSRFMVQSHIHTQRSQANDLTCIICVEPFTAGELIRSLPCLHQFHADCVDPWLREEGTCPACKYRAGPGSRQRDCDGDIEQN